MRRLIFFAVLLAGLTPDAAGIMDYDVSDKVLHFLAFLGLALLFDAAYRRIGRAAKGEALLLYGLAIEVLQLFVPGRDFSVMDLAINALGIPCYFTFLSPLLVRHSGESSYGD